MISISKTKTNWKKYKEELDILYNDENEGE
jgi:hypothetical protein